MLDVRESAYPYGYVTVQRAGALMENNDSYFIIWESNNSADFHLKL